MQKDRKELINLIEEKSNISSIISDYISLEKKGNNHVGLCPFHSDTNPSMSVSDAKGIFKCFTCQAGGGPINFVQNYEGISFNDALIKLAEKLDIDWRQYITKKVVKLNPEEVKGWEINEEALNFFKYNLTNSTNNQLNKYVQDRSLTQDIIEKFDIGYSGDGLANFLINKGYSEDEIVKYGLAKRREDTTLQDYFINRLIFTIKNRDGKVIGFSGRVIENSKYAKYLNSPETPVFKKTKILYNLHRAKTPANLKKELIVVEGFMDVIALSKSGIDHAIATMGTAFTKDHNTTIRSITTNVILAFDSDVAGINATIQNGKSMLSEGFNIDVVKIPSGKDFDELSKSGADKVSETLSEKVKFVNFYKEMIYKRLDANKDNISFDVLKELLRLLKINNDEFVASSIINDIVVKYNIDKEVLMNEYKSNANQVNKTNEIAPPPYVGDVQMIEQQYQNNYQLKQEVNKTINNNSTLKDIERVKLISMENTLVYLALSDETAFYHLHDKPIVFIEDSLTSFWTPIENYESIDKESDEYKKQLEIISSKIDHNQITELNTIQAFDEYYDKYIYIINIYNKKLLANQIKSETTLDEKKHLHNILKKNSV